MSPPYGEKLRRNFGDIWYTSLYIYTYPHYVHVAPMCLSRVYGFETKIVALPSVFKSPYI